MLRELHIRNFALIEDARVRFGDGFNVLTGETGVGKSLVIGALGLLLGGRPGAGLIRQGADALAVEGLFEVASAQLREELGEALGFSLDPDVAELLLERHYALGGRGRCRANGKPVGVATLRAAGELLLDIHGQREHESLLEPANQRAVLDAFGQGVGETRSRFTEAYYQLRDLEQRFETLRQTEDIRREKLELLRFRRGEFAELAPRADEYGGLREEASLLANAERVQEAVAEAIQSLYEAEDSGADRVQRAERNLDGIAGFHKELDAARQAFAEAAIQIEEGIFALRRFQESFEFDPDRQDVVQDRLRRYEDLASKHGVPPEELPEVNARTEGEIAGLEAAEKDLSDMRAKLRSRRRKLLAIGRELSERRVEAGRDLTPRVEGEMRDLAMPAGRFRVDVTPLAADESLWSAIGPAGLDAVEFMLTTNPGEDLKPLRRVGSGGEVARIMLAVKGCLAQVDRVPVFVFDEIDANIGGRLGAVIGEKLAALARGRQVICVTHLPQIAAHAHTQIAVRKTVERGRTFTRIRELDSGERVEEIAEMIHGDRRTETTRRQAEEMLHAAGAPTRGPR